VLTDKAGEIRQQRVVPRERAIEIEERQRRGPGGWGSSAGGCGGRLQIGQAALPAAVSCRSTYCRIPPWR
jgi:hypothetical protein